MELTKAQRDFFADLDLDSAIKAGEGKVHFTFPHKGCVVEVAAYGACEADITVKPNTSLALLNIPDTENVTGPEVLRRVHAAANKSEYPKLKAAWLDTPYVDRWPADVMGSRIKFSWLGELVTYELRASKSTEAPDTTTVELLVGCEKVHTFLIPLRCPKKPTAEFMYELANAITEAWRDAVLDEYNEEESK